MDTKALAMLGVLSAIGAALRPLGAGTAGIEIVFFLLVLAGRVFGPGFGFVLGSTTLFASALLTGGVGPWLPFQMLAASWVGLGAGLLPQRRGSGRDRAAAPPTASVAAYWLRVPDEPVVLAVRRSAPTPSCPTSPGAPVLENLHRFCCLHSPRRRGWDTGRAITNVDRDRAARTRRAGRPAPGRPSRGVRASRAGNAPPARGVDRPIRHR